MRWWLFDFRGSSRLLRGATNAGVRDLEYAITLSPESADVHWIAGDAYTYGLADPQRAFVEATLALNGGLDTPRVHAILAASYVAFGDRPAATVHIKRHFDLVTTEVALAPPMLAGDLQAVAIAPGRVVEIAIPAVAGETITIATSSHDYFDTVAVLLAPDGTAVTAGTTTRATLPHSSGLRRRRRPTDFASRFSKRSTRASCWCHAGSGTASAWSSVDGWRRPPATWRESRTRSAASSTRSRRVPNAQRKAERGGLI